MDNERGMSLIEVLIGVAIASIVLAACYGSYTVVSGYYRTQDDLSTVRQTLRQSLQILGRDLQMAGFFYLETAGGAITEPLRTTNGQSPGCPNCDTLRIVFDKCTGQGSGMGAICFNPNDFERKLVVYEVKACPAGSPIASIRQRTTRLCRTVYDCPQGASCAAPSGRAALQGQDGADLRAQGRKRGVSTLAKSTRSSREKQILQLRKRCSRDPTFHRVRCVEKWSEDRNDTHLTL